MCCAYFLFSLNAESIVVVPDTPKVPEPVQPITSLLCEVQTSTAVVELRWQLPSGVYLTPNNDTNEVRVSLERLADEGNVTIRATVLTIAPLSYQLAGDYSCEVRDTTTPGAEWIAADVELRLKGIIKCHHHRCT